MTAQGLEYLQSDAKEAFEERAQLWVKPALACLGTIAYALAAAEFKTSNLEDIVLWQQRVGQNGSTVITPKFRTLPNTPDVAARSAGAFNPYAKRIGHVLRITGGDESLQGSLLGTSNKGQMHIVGGYRPLLKRDVDRELDVAESLGLERIMEQVQEGREVTRPSITGLGALYGHYKFDMTHEQTALNVVSNRLKLEAWYYSVASPTLDKQILKHTPLVLAEASRGDKAISSDDSSIPRSFEKSTRNHVLSRVGAQLLLDHPVH